MGEAEYRVVAPKAGLFAFWVRLNPVQAKLDYKLIGGDWTPITLDATVDRVNIASDGKVDLRFLAWIKVGSPPLQNGDNTVVFRMDSKNNHHGMLDCFVFTTEPFTPQGTLKPGEAAKEAEAETGWFVFAPPADIVKPGSAIDLRELNEKVAGDNGRIAVKGSQFIHTKTGVPVPGSLKLAAKTDLKDLSVTSERELGHIVAVSLDGASLATSKRILLQAMSEEKTSGFRTALAGEGLHRIVSIGRDPWLVRDIDGMVRFHRPDAANLKVIALDHSGYRAREIGDAAEFSLIPQVLY